MNHGSTLPLSNRKILGPAGCHQGRPKGRRKPMSSTDAYALDVYVVRHGVVPPQIKKGFRV